MGRPHIHQTGIRFKLILLSLISLAGMATIILMFIFTLAKDLYTEKKSQTKLLVDAGMGLISYFHDLETRGALSRDKAQELARQSLSSTKFETTGYYWINDGEGLMIMHPVARELVGKSVLNTPDADGYLLFRDFIKTAKAGGGWVKYSWPKPGTPAPYPKISYVAYFQPWNWILGTGIYLDDVENEITSKALRAIGVISFFFIIIILATIYLSNRFMSQLRSIAIRDPLTELYTRRYLQEIAPMMISYHDRNMRMHMAAIFFDIDHFKRVNDAYGHVCGDHVLKNIAASTKQMVRKGDLVIRYGGEEFLVITLGENKDDIIKMAERIRMSAKKMIQNYSGREFYVTLSAGIAFREHGESFELLIDRADEKMYEAKIRGRDCLVYE